MPTVKSILEEVNKLTPFERAEVIEHIIESFDIEPDPGIQRAWADEAEKRLNDYRNDKTGTVSEQEVFTEIKNLDKEIK